MKSLALVLSAAAALSLIGCSQTKFSADKGLNISESIEADGDVAEMPLASGDTFTPEGIQDPSGEIKVPSCTAEQQAEANYVLHQNGEDNVAGVSQSGAENMAQIYQDGKRNMACVMQTGDKNDAHVEQSGGSNTAIIVQTGH